VVVFEVRVMTAMTVTGTRKDPARGEISGDGRRMPFLNQRRRLPAVSVLTPSTICVGLQSFKHVLPLMLATPELSA
jgi:hypothetical protein